MPQKIQDISELEWDDNNIFECAGHGITPVLVKRVLAQSPLFFLNKPEKSGSHLMIGPAEPGAEARLWTIVLLGTAAAGRWRPITGWMSEPSEIRKYLKWVGKPTKEQRRNAKKTK
jgi:hypothetical protein